MKYCKQCGSEIPSGKKFCVKCGAKVENKLNSVKIVVSGLLLFLIITGIGFGTFYLSDAQKLNRSLDAQMWAEAEKAYDSMLRDGNKEKAEDTIVKSLEKIKAQYIEQEITREEAISTLESIEDIGYPDEKISDYFDFINVLEESRKAFVLAEKYWEEKDYANAILQYRMVTDIDENYDYAKTQILECETSYKDEVLKKVDELEKQEDYGEAVEQLKLAQSILGDDSDLEILFVKYEKAGVEKLLDAYEAKSDYAEAVRLLQQSDSLLKNNADLQTRQENNIRKYREILFSEARDKYEEQGYEVAIGVLREGLQLLSEDNEILEQIELYENCAPVELKNLNVLSTEMSNSLDNKYEDKTIEDLYGNSYQGYFELISYKGEESYVEFFTDAKYSNLKGTFFVNTRVQEDFSIEFRVYADGVQIYKSGYITRTNQAVSFDIPINHADKLRIESYSTDYSWSHTNPRIILSDAEVYNVLE